MEEETINYRKELVKLLNMMNWPRPKIYNAVRVLSRHMSVLAKIHRNVMLRFMEYCVGTSEQVRKFKPNRRMDIMDK